MTTAVKATYCWRCGSIGPGEHGPDGRFNQWSVDVDEGDLIAAHSHRPTRAIADVRWVIAFGKHIGSRD